VTAAVKWAAAIAGSVLLWPFGGTTGFCQRYLISTYAGGAPPPSAVAATSIGIGEPNAVGVDASGNVYFTGLHCVFKLDKQGILTVIAGSGRPGFSGDGGPAVDAQLNDPSGLAFDHGGSLYIADYGHDSIRKISPEGIISSVGRPFVPVGVAVDNAGNIFVSAPAANRVFKITPDGAQTTYAGTIRTTFLHNCTGDGGPATSAELYQPRALALDGAGLSARPWSGYRPTSNVTITLKRGAAVPIRIEDPGQLITMNEGKTRGAGLLLLAQDHPGSFFRSVPLLS